MRFMSPKPAACAVLVCVAGAGIAGLAGCQSSLFAHRLETRTVNRFAKALAEGDAERLRTLTSAEFSSKALSDEEAVAEVRKIWPVSGKLEVVSVADLDEVDRTDPSIPEKLVTIKDERGWKTDYRLIRDPDTDKWVIDDILITRSHKGLSATKTVSEQVEFIRVVRNFTDAWRSGSREQRLAGMTAECRAELEPLPDEVINHFASRLFPSNDRSAEPEATMDDDIAVVQLRRATGTLFLQLKRVEGQWLVDDVNLDGAKGGETIASLRKSAVAYAAAATFLTAYNAADRETLKSVASDSFFDATLKTANLSEIPLPPAEAGEHGQLKIVGRQGELVIDEGDRTVKLSLVRVDNPETDVHAVTDFRVEDVTLYEDGGKVKKRLAAALVAEPLAQLYADALINRDLAQLRVMATSDFNEQVWSRVTDELMATISLAEISSGEREILSVIHNGASTEVTMMQAGRAMTLVLKDDGGEVKVDDVLLAVADRPPSLKTTLAHLLPVLRLRSALANGDLPAVQQNCSSDFNRLIWAQVREIPPVAAQAQRFLNAPLHSVQLGGSEATIHLGDENYGSVITLLQNGTAWKVDDIRIVAGPRPQDQAALKLLMRDGLANGTLFAGHRPQPTTTSTSGAIQQVGYEQNSSPATVSPLKEPRPLDLGASAGHTLPIQIAPEAQQNDDTAIAPQTGSALPFSEPLW